MHVQGFIQNFSVGVGKNMYIDPHPQGGVWGDAPPGNFRNLHALEVASGAPK